jgi:hypothetical protein
MVSIKESKVMQYYCTYFVRRTYGILVLRSNGLASSRSNLEPVLVVTQLDLLID